MPRIKVLARALSVAIPTGFASLVAAPGPASACPPGCPSPVHPCCCPTPCPTFDGSKKGMAETINKWANDALEELGSELPVFDLAGSPLSCLTGGGGADSLKSASDAANASNIGMGLGETGFTESPFNLDPSAAGMDGMFPVGDDIGNLTDQISSDFGMLTDNFSSDLGDLGSKIGSIDLGIDGVTDSLPGLGDGSFQFGDDLSRLGSQFSADLGVLGENFSSDLGGLTGKLDLGSFTSGPGALGDLNNIFPEGQGLGAFTKDIDALTQGFNEDLGLLTGGISNDLGALSEKLGLDQAGSVLDGIGAQAASDLGKFQSELGSSFGGFSDLFPGDEAFAQLSEGMSSDLGKLAEAIDLPADGGLDGILSGDFSLAGPSDQGAATAGLGDLFPVGEGVEALSSGMGEDLSALARDLGVASGGSLGDFAASGAGGNQAGSLQDLFSVGRGSSSTLGRDLAIATAASGAPNARPQGAAGGRGAALTGGIPDGMEEIVAGLPEPQRAAGMSRVRTTPGIESVTAIQGLADLGRLPGVSESDAFKTAKATGDISHLLALSKVSKIPGVQSGADLDRINATLQQAGIDGLGDTIDLGAALDQIPIKSTADISALEGISDSLGIGDVGGLSQFADLTSLGGFNSLADAGQMTALANIPGVSSITGIVSGNPQQAMKSLSALASCAGASTPVTSAMIDGAGLIGSFQAASNALGGAGGRDLPDVEIASPRVKVADVSLPASQLPSLSIDLDGKSADLGQVRKQYIADHYAASRLPGATDDARRNRFATTRRLATIAYARALAKQHELATEMPLLLQQLEAAPAQAANVADDVRKNSKLRAELTHRLQELQELMTYWVQLSAAATSAGESDITIPPSALTPAARPADSDRGKGTEKRRALTSQARAFQQAAEEAAEAHNSLVAANRVRDHLPKLLEIVEDHEVRKHHLIAMENEIKSHLANLYQDPETAWQTLKSDLLSYDGTGYLDANKWSVAEGAARSMVPPILAQSEATRYGKRLRSDCPATPRRGPDGDRVYCPPYTTGPITASDGRGRIESHYSGYERYKVRPRMRVAGGEAMGSSPVEDHLFQGLQYYLEAHKRKTYWDGLRRGTANGNAVTTTADLWNELRTAAPACLNAPVPTSESNIRKRPGLFDIDPDCEHRTWSKTGFKGTLINHMQLGGVDQSIWLIRNAEYENQVVYGQRKGVLARVERARDAAPADLPAKLSGIGRGQLAAETRHLQSVIDAIEADASSTKRVEIAR